MIAETWTPGGMVLVWQDVAGLKTFLIKAGRSDPLYTRSVKMD